jgi:hypothetical protein
MRNLRCVIGRHDWQAKHDKGAVLRDLQSAGVLSRSRPLSVGWAVRHSDKDLPLPPHLPTDGGAGGAAGGGW